MARTGESARCATAPAPVAPVRAGWRERSFGVALAFCVLWGLGLMLLGAYALVRLLGGRG